MRLDKWLWCARFFKTRSLAADAIRTGKVRIDNERSKPAKMISPGDVLNIRRNAFKYEITILELPRARLPASKAALLFSESDASVRDRELLETQMKSGSGAILRSHGRPTKRDRRDLMKFKKTGHADEE